MPHRLLSLLDTNRRWSERRRADDPGFFERLSRQQAPEYLWIGCSDSRVPANQIVGLAPGEVFVHRNVANIVHTGDLNLLSVLEFAVNVLKVEHVIVCGHYGCGGVRAALHGNTGGLVGHWVAPVVDLARRNRARLDPIATEGRRIDALCEMNVEMQVARVAATPILRAAWEAGQNVSVHGWIYGLRDGLLRDLGVSRSGLEEPPAPAGSGPDAADAAEGRLGPNGRSTRMLSALRLLGDAGDASAAADEQEG